MLILFDIDLTLTNTSGAGMHALVDAGRELFGEGFHARGIDFAGRLDPLIIDDLLTLNAEDPTPRNRGALRACYRGHLERRLASPGTAVALPGVQDLIRALLRRGTQTLGLLTGNFEETGRMKLHAAGIDDSAFMLAAWGDHSPYTPPRRDHLVPVALDRYYEQTGRRADPSRVTVIGDTPHDVGCALAHGCRSIGVATGRTSLEELSASGASLAVRDLTGTEALVSWLEGVSGG